MSKTMAEAARVAMPQPLQLHKTIAEAARVAMPQPLQLHKTIAEAARLMDRLIAASLDDLELHYPSSEEFAAAVKPVAREFAEQLRLLKSPLAVVAYLGLLIQILQLIVSVTTAVHELSPHRVTTPVVVNQTTNVTIVENGYQHVP